MPDPTSPPRPADVPVPDLDDLRFQPLVDAAKRSLPGLAPRWTDHNVSDPGITLIEACAERVDRLAYRANRLTPRQRTALMRLMGIAPAAASPARVTLRFTLVRTQEAAVRIPRGTVIASGGPQPVDFTTITDLTIPAGQPDGTAEAMQLEYVTDEPLGVSTGAPGQRFTPARRPWHDGMASSAPVIGVRVRVGTRSEDWRQVPTFAEAGEDDPCFRWDSAAKEVEFAPLVPYTAGAQRVGAVPPEGAVITATYAVGGGRRGNLPVGTVLAVFGTPGPPIVTVDADVPAGTTVTVDAVLRAGGDEESWQEALERTYLDLVPLRRAVTTDDYERVLGEQVRDLARVRVTAVDRRPNPDVPTGLSVPARPVNVDTACVDWDGPERWVSYYAEDACLRVPLDGASYGFTRVWQSVSGPCSAEDTSPFGSAPDAVFRFRDGTDSARLWFRGTDCRWDGDSSAHAITDVFPGLTDPFTADLDGFCATTNADGSWEVFFVKDDRFCHRAYRFTFQGRKLTPVPEQQATVSTLAAGFPGLPQPLRRAPDAVTVTADGTFYFLKGAVTCPAVWRSEDSGLAVYPVPRPVGSPEEPFTPGDLEGIREEIGDCVERFRLLGERLRLREPVYVPFGIEVQVQPWADTGSTVGDRVTRRLRRWFHPTAGGRSGRGWPWGQAVYAGEVGMVLEQVLAVRRTFAIDLTTGGGSTKTQRVTVPDDALVQLGDVTVTIVDSEE